jgi:hypothetical protein
MVVMLVVVFVSCISLLKRQWITQSFSVGEKRLNVAPLGEIRRFSGTSGRAQVRDMIMKNPLNADIVHGIRTGLCWIIDLYRRLRWRRRDGDGRSLLANLLANSFSFDQKTLLIDADFFNTDGLSSELASATSAGLAELLRGEVQLEKARITLGDHLDFIPHGKTTIFFTDAVVGAR